VPSRTVDCRTTLAGVADYMNCAVYLLLLSLLPLWPAVELLRSTLDARRGIKHRNQLPGSDDVATNALVAAIVALIFAMLATVQQFTKVIRLQGENCGVLQLPCVSVMVHGRMSLTFTIFTAIHRFLGQDNVSLSFLAVWAVSDFCVLFRTLTSFDYLPAKDIDRTDEYMFGQTMAIIPFALLLPRIKESGIGGRISTAETNRSSALILCSLLVIV